MIVCVTGLPAAGKSSIGKILHGMGFRVYELGDIVRQMMKEERIPITPDSDKRFTVRLRRRYGNLVTVKKLAEKAKLRSGGKISIIGFRSKPELDYIKRFGKSITIAILAPRELRFERMRKRMRPDAQRSRKEFLERDSREEGFGLWAAINSADYVISGTGTIAQLRKEIKQIMKLSM